MEALALDPDSLHLGEPVNEHGLVQPQKITSSVCTPQPGKLLQRQCSCGQHSIVAAECAECQNKRSTLRRYSTNQAHSSTIPPIVHEVLGSPGQPLDRATRAFMESRFGHDFSRVRVHTDARAVESARTVSALAYTVGRDVVFGAGQYTPSTAGGRRLLAHELTHVVQQSNQGGLQSHTENSAANDTLEHEAEGIATNLSESPSLPHSPYLNRQTQQLQPGHSGQLTISSSGSRVLSRFPSPVAFGVYTPGLSIMPPVIKEGYDGTAYTAIKGNWGLSSWERRWQIYDADDKLLYELFYTWPQPTLYIPREVVAKGKAGGRLTPWSVWHEVTETTIPFGGSDPENFPYTYIKFYVYETWNDFMADPKAQLSDIKQTDEAGAKPGKPTPLDSSIVSGARSLVDYGNVVAMHEAYLREIYDTAAKGITETAKELVNKGLSQGDAAKWANEARNELKAKIRADGNPILKKVFESRNLNKYGNKLGPNYQELYQKYSKQGLSPEEINQKIIGSSGKANIKLNRWSGRLKVAGRIMLAIDIALAGARVYLAPEGEKAKVALEEVARIGGALAFGALGAKGGAAAGAAVGALFGGAGAAPGAIIGGIIGGIGGAIFGGSLGQTAVEKLYEMFPPSDCVFEGEFSEEDQE
jgi:hypothetical protein